MNTWRMTVESKVTLINIRTGEEVVREQKTRPMPIATWKAKELIEKLSAKGTDASAIQSIPGLVNESSSPPEDQL